MSGIVLDRVGRKFGSTVALEEISIEIPDGEFLALLGPSGCGKSTLLRIIAGLLAPTSGRVVVDGRDITALPPGQRDIAMVFQSYALYPHLSVERNLGFGLRVRHRTPEEIKHKVAAAAEQLKLTPLLARKPRELSGGQRQRVTLGRAVVREPRAFLMDEPLSNLDAQLRTSTRLELTELHQRLATTFVYVTHDQVEAMTMSTRIMVMSHGHIEQIGTPAEIYDEPRSTFVASFIGAPPMNLLPTKAISLAGRVRLLAEGVDVDLAPGEVEERPITLGIRPEHLRIVSDPDGGPRLSGTVVAVENLGSEEIAFCDIGSAQVAVRGPRPLGISAGDEVTLTASLDRVCLFDPETTRRICWIDEESAAEANEDHRRVLASPSVRVG